MIITGIASVIAAMMWLLIDGSMWRNTMRIRLLPVSLAATTKSSSRSERKRPRTSRPSVVQPISARITVIAR